MIEDALTLGWLEYFQNEMSNHPDKFAIIQTLHGLNWSRHTWLIMLCANLRCC